MNKEFPPGFEEDVKNISIDFDGVIHDWNKGWHDGTCYGEPIEGALKAVKLLSEKYDIPFIEVDQLIEEKYNNTLKNILNKFGNDNFSNEWLRDDTLENISSKNKYFGEYTFHYWFWKNILPKIEDNHWIGFCAYRQYWSNKKRYRLYINT